MVQDIITAYAYYPFHMLGLNLVGLVALAIIVDIFKTLKEIGE